MEMNGRTREGMRSQLPSRAMPEYGGEPLSEYGEYGAERCGAPTPPYGPGGLTILVNSPHRSRRDPHPDTDARHIR